MPRPTDTLAAADGRWPDILRSLAGLTDEQLTPTSKEGPCPHCGGETRYRWISNDGPGQWFCSHCGGAKKQGGYDAGKGLLCRVSGWDFKQAADEVDRFLHGHAQASGTWRPTPPPRQRRPAPPELRAFRLLEAAGQLADGEGYSPNRAKGRSYSSRWLRWSEENVDAAEAIVLETETAEGVDTAPEPEPVAPTPEPSQPAGPLTLKQVREQLRAMVADGASRVELDEQIIHLAARADISPSTLGGLVRSLQAEQVAADAIDSERQQLVAAAERSAISGAMLTLEALFPASLAQAVRILTEYLPSDDLTSAGLLLSTCAGVTKLGSRLTASRARNFWVPLNLFVSLVGRSGIKKGPLWRALHSAPLLPLQQDAARAAARALDTWRQENHGKKPSERTDPPRSPRVSCTEFTGEALTEILAIQEAHGLGLIIGKEELRGLFGGLNAYRAGRGSDPEQLLETYDGVGAAQIRVGAEGGGRFYSSCQLTIAGTIQPDVLQELVRNGDASGLWARFTFLPVPERVVPLPLDETEEEAQATEASQALVADVVRSIHCLPQRHLSLSREAWRQFVTYETRCQTDGIRASLGAQAAAWSKAPGKALRLAGLLHLVHGVCPDGEHDGRDLEVSAQMLERAQNMVDSLTQWTLGLHQQAAEGETTGLMERLHRLSLRQGCAVGWRDLSQSLSARLRKNADAAMAEAAANALVEMGVGVKAGAGRGWSYRATGELPV
jgi:hypothetical protein